jgi:uncharacterized protein
VLKKHLSKWKKPRFAIGAIGFIYILCCLVLFFGQRYFIYHPDSQLSMLPSASAFKLPYQDVWISIRGSHEKLHGWWIPATFSRSEFAPIPNEPIGILKTPKIMLYFCGVGHNMGDYNYLARVAAFRQLGFGVLVFDYRGYGRSNGSFPSESQMYEDSRAVWDYLRDVRKIPPQQIVIYGESLGGAIALDLAIKHPEASGLIMQSSFTSMAEVVDTRAFTRIFPIDLMLTERFDSLSKMPSLQIPVLLLHGSIDPIVPSEMSQKLYDAARTPKQILFITGAEHVKIYQPRDRSYLKAIQRFVESLPNAGADGEPK